MKLKTGIIGCGKVGDFHAKAYAQLENSEFTAVCDANLERAKAFAERYNVHAYSDIAEMIQKEHLNVVSVCTPHPIHCDPAVTAATHGAALGRAKAAAFWSTRHPISSTCCCGTWATSMKYTASGRT